jgi:hypothetical protein
MISIVLLLKLLGGVGVVLCWVYIWRLALRTERRMECLKEHYDARISAIAKQNASLEKQNASLMKQQASLEDETDAELLETRRKALEAERRFSEGIASILNFSATVTSVADAMASGDKTAYDAGTGRKGD